MRSAGADQFGLFDWRALDLHLPVWIFLGFPVTSVAKFGIFGMLECRQHRRLRDVPKSYDCVANFLFHGRPFCLLPENIRTETATRAYRFVIVKDN